MNAISKPKSWLNDPQLDLKSLGFTFENLSNVHTEQSIRWTLDLTMEMSIQIIAYYELGEYSEVSVELVINGMAEVQDIRNKYDLIILIAALKPARINKEIDVTDLLSHFGKLTNLKRTETRLMLQYVNFPSEIGVFNQWLMMIRQLFPEYIHTEKIEAGFGNRLCMVLKK